MPAARSQVVLQILLDDFALAVAVATAQVASHVQPAVAAAVLQPDIAAVKLPAGAPRCRRFRQLIW